MSAPCFALRARDGAFATRPSTPGRPRSRRVAVREAVAAMAAVAGLLLGSAAAAQALPAPEPLAAPSLLSTGPSVYLQLGHASHHSNAWTLGYTHPWRAWRGAFLGSEVQGYWDLSLSRWDARGPSGGFGTTVLGITPSFRFVPDAGRSRWFFDTGVGATLASRRYVTTDKAFSTRANFATHLGVGLALGERRQHEWQLRLEHVSNAGLKKPNPGENFLQLRYALHF